VYYGSVIKHSKLLRCVLTARVNACDARRRYLTLEERIHLRLSTRVNARHAR